jgi:hypothetical protein
MAHNPARTNWGFGMATYAIQAGGLVIAGAIAWVGIQGLRGVPDKSGKVTSKGTAIVCLCIGVLLGAAAVVARYLMWDQPYDPF